jgi:hypothetical protein
MNFFTVDFTLNELIFLRQSLDLVSVQGKDAKFVASLQMKIENEVGQIQQMLQEEEERKQNDLQNLLEETSSKTSKK